MTDYREILRLGRLNYSQRYIAQAVGSSRNTAEKVLWTARAKGVQWPLEDDVANRNLEELLFSEKCRNAGMYTESDYLYIQRELAKSGATMALLWKEYCRKCYESGETPDMSTHVWGQVPEEGKGDKGHHAHPAQVRRCHQGGLGWRCPSGV